MLKTSRNAPAHLFLDDTPYFITGAIYNKRPLLAGSEIKKQLIELLIRRFDHYGWRLDDWVILDNHYHLLGYSRIGKDLDRLIRSIHSQSAGFILTQTHSAPPIWWNYWDYCPRNEEEYRVRQNYLLYNPVKHGYVQDLKDYPWSSFNDRLKREGREALTTSFRTHSSFRDLKVDEDDF
jgi:putative transposase